MDYVFSLVVWFLSLLCASFPPVDPPAIAYSLKTNALATAKTNCLCTFPLTDPGYFLLRAINGFISILPRPWFLECPSTVYSTFLS